MEFFLIQKVKSNPNAFILFGVLFVFLFLRIFIFSPIFWNLLKSLIVFLTFCIKKNSKNYLASLKNKKTNIQLDFYSNLPGVQLYTSQGLRYKNKLAPYQGICLETQHYPDSPNNKNFPSTLTKPKKLYKYFTKINIS